jgi:hypothetical protein
MILNRRLRAAFQAFGRHLLISLVVASCAAAMVFLVWYPYPYSKLLGGRELFALMISVDVIVGPLLTLVVFSPNKSRTQLFRDLGVIVFVQVAALSYGLYTMMLARPVLLGFEGDRFRVVRAIDISNDENERAAVQSQFVSILGPKLIGVRLSKSGDKDYLQSIQLAVQGLHPAFRPSRWVNYQGQKLQVISSAKPLDLLEKKYPQSKKLTEVKSLNESKLGYLPLVAGRHDDWVVLVDLNTAEPKAFLPLDGW